MAVLRPEPEWLTPEEHDALDREKTGRWRCIGCGKFLKEDGHWNQCSDCDTRTPEDDGLTSADAPPARYLDSSPSYENGPRSVTRARRGSRRQAHRGGDICVMNLAGRINGWRCDRCGAVTYCVHVDDGVTPMFLACRADGVKCTGIGVSLMYPQQPPPQHVIDAVSWEWYAPEQDERARLVPDAAEHVRKGGLLLRPLTDAGREAIREGKAES